MNESESSHAPRPCFFSLAWVKKKGNIDSGQIQGANKTLWVLLQENKIKDVTKQGQGCSLPMRSRKRAAKFDGADLVALHFPLADAARQDLRHAMEKPSVPSAGQRGESSPFPWHHIILAVLNAGRIENTAREVLLEERHASTWVGREARSRAVQDT